MPPVKPNHGCHLPNMEDATVDNKGFKIPPLLYSYFIGVIYTIHFKNGLFKPFKTILRQIRRAVPVGTRTQSYKIWRYNMAPMINREIFPLIALMWPLLWIELGEASCEIVISKSGQEAQKAQKTRFIPICRHKKRDFIPTQKLREEHENCGNKTPFTTSCIKPTRDRIILSLFLFSDHHDIIWNSQLLLFNHNYIFYWMI